MCSWHGFSMQDKYHGLVSPCSHCSLSAASYSNCNAYLNNIPAIHKMAHVLVLQSNITTLLQLNVQNRTSHTCSSCDLECTIRPFGLNLHVMCGESNGNIPFRWAMSMGMHQEAIGAGLKATKRLLALGCEEGIDDEWREGEHRLKTVAVTV